jgi:hypothetical protein
VAEAPELRADFIADNGEVGEIWTVHKLEGTSFQCRSTPAAS